MEHLKLFNFHIIKLWVKYQQQYGKMITKKEEIINFLW